MKPTTRFFRVLSRASLALLVLWAGVAMKLPAQDESWLPGSIQVTIGPGEALAAGARWSVSGGPLRASGDTEVDLAPGRHAVRCDRVAGWSEPPVFELPVVGGATQTALRAS